MFFSKLEVIQQKQHTIISAEVSKYCLLSYFTIGTASSRASLSLIYHTKYQTPENSSTQKMRLSAIAIGNQAELSDLAQMTLRSL